MATPPHGIWSAYRKLTLAKRLTSIHRLFLIQWQVEQSSQVAGTCGEHKTGVEVRCSWTRTAMYSGQSQSPAVTLSDSGRRALTTTAIWEARSMGLIGARPSRRALFP